MNMKVEAIRRAKQGMLEDEDLQVLIAERIEEDGSFWVAAGKNRTVINVEVTDGHVTLTGNVPTIASASQRATPSPSASPEPHRPTPALPVVFYPFRYGGFSSKGGPAVSFCHRPSVQPGDPGWPDVFVGRTVRIILQRLTKTDESIAPGLQPRGERVECRGVQRAGVEQQCLCNLASHDPG